MQELSEEVRRKIDLFNRLPRDKRVAVLKKVLSYFRDLKEREGGLVAWMKFNEWLASDDGAIMFPHIFKEEYREVMIDIIYYYLLILSKITFRLLKP